MPVNRERLALTVAAGLVGCVLLGGLTGCNNDPSDDDDNDTVNAPDASVAVDASVIQDSGSVPADASLGLDGATTVDSGTMVVDAGSTPDAGGERDAGASGDAAQPPDASTPSDAGITVDASTPLDAAVPIPDAHVEQDAASPADASVPVADASVALDAATSTDSGHHVVEDAGLWDAGNFDAGCIPECPLGNTGCFDTTSVMTCVEDEQGCVVWSEPVACQQGDVCNAGECGTACAPEDTRCLDSVTLQSCIAGQLSTHICVAGCDAIARSCRVCEPGSWQCEPRTGGGFTLQTCPTGTSWSNRAVCQECACVQAQSVVMQCRYTSGDQQTQCTMCTEDGLGCLP